MCKWDGDKEDSHRESGGTELVFSIFSLHICPVFPWRVTYRLPLLTHNSCFLFGLQGAIVYLMASFWVSSHPPLLTNQPVLLKIVQTLVFHRRQSLDWSGGCPSLVYLKWPRFGKGSVHNNRHSKSLSRAERWEPPFPQSLLQANEFLLIYIALYLTLMSHFWPWKVLKLLPLINTSHLWWL